MHPRPVAGRSVVTRRAIVDIVRTAVQSSYGVTGFSDPSLGSRILGWLARDRRGIRLSIDGGIRLDLYVTVAYGVPVAEVARQVDSAVRYAIRRALGREIASLSIHVDGLRYQPTPPPVPQPVEPSEPAATETSPTPPAGPAAPDAPAARSAVPGIHPPDADAHGDGSRNGRAALAPSGGGAGSGRPDEGHS